MCIMSIFNYYAKKWRRKYDEILYPRNYGSRSSNHRRAKVIPVSIWRTRQKHLSSNKTKILQIGTKTIQIFFKESNYKFRDIWNWALLVGVWRSKLKYRPSHRAQYNILIFFFQIFGIYNNPFREIIHSNAGSSEPEESITQSL